MPSAKYLFIFKYVCTISYNHLIDCYRLPIYSRPALPYDHRHAVVAFAVEKWMSVFVCTIHFNISMPSTFNVERAEKFPHKKDSFVDFSCVCPITSVTLLIITYSILSFLSIRQQNNTHTSIDKWKTHRIQSAFIFDWPIVSRVHMDQQTSPFHYYYYYCCVHRILLFDSRTWWKSNWNHFVRLYITISTQSAECVLCLWRRGREYRRKRCTERGERISDGQIGVFHIDTMHSNTQAIKPHRPLQPLDSFV